MFHSSSSRHEQYIHRSINTRVKKKRSSLESEASGGADSGYTSSSSTPSKVQDSPTSPTPPTLDYSYTPTNISQDSIPRKKKNSKRYQPPRQPDLVYSCPRPLAFPFHNDDHFLPIAEADPRDVARVSPASIDRSGSLKSSKSTLGSKGSMYDQHSAHRSIHSTTSSRRSTNYSDREGDAESFNSRRSSLLNSIQRGTVRSIRSFFQLPDSLSNKDLSRVQSQSTTYSSTSIPSSYSRTPPLERLEIKKGTVQSIKDLFSRKSTTTTAHVTPSRYQQHQPVAGRVGVTIGQFESSATISDFSRANLSKKSTSTPTVSSTKKTADPKLNPSKVSPVSPVKPKKPFTSRAAEFASRALWKKPVSVSPVTPQSATTATSSSLPTPPPPPPSTKPLPKSPKPTLKTQVKNLSARVLDIPKSWRKPADQNTNTTNDTQPKRSIFSFKRSDISASAAAAAGNKKKDPSTEEHMEPPSKVKKMWKSFKNLVSGKKTSRVGVL